MEIVMDRKTSIKTKVTSIRRELGVRLDPADST